MKYCVDTWFLIQLSKKNKKAERVIKETVDGKTRLIIPSITFVELTRKMLKRGKMKKIFEFIDNLEKNEKIQISQTTKELVLEAGKISYTFNIHTVDSIIAATAKEMECKAILSKDSDYTKFCKTNKIKLKNW